MQRIVANTVVQCHLFPPGRAQVSRTSEAPYRSAKPKLLPTALLGKHKSSVSLDTTWDSSDLPFNLLLHHQLSRFSIWDVTIFTTSKIREGNYDSQLLYRNGNYEPGYF